MLIRDDADSVVPYQLNSVTVTVNAQGSGSMRADARTDARAEGYAIGWAQGMREARESTLTARQRAEEELVRLLTRRDGQVEQALRSLAAAADKFRGLTVRRAEELADYIISAAVELAEAVVAAHVSADVMATTRNAMARALAQLPAGPAVIVRLNPEDHAELTAADAEELIGTRDVKLVADARLARGDAIAENALSTVDATVAGALRRVRMELDA